MSITDMSASKAAAHRILVGTGISTAAGRGCDPVAEAQAAEKAGYDFVSASDHPVGADPTYELLTMLTWVAARTERIGIATRVLGTPFRRPAMVAKSIESLQRLSGGRVILGLGSGHLDDEIVALGSERLSPRRKVDGLADAISIMRAAWAGAGATHHGVEHSVHDLTLTPRPEVPVPIWLGTYGPRALAVTGRLADGWIPSLGSAPAQALPGMLDRIRSAATDAGREAGSIRAVLNLGIRVGASSPGDEDDVLTGSVPELIESLDGFVRQGFSGFNLQPAEGQAERVAAEVLPAIRQLG